MCLQWTAACLFATALTLSTGWGQNPAPAGGAAAPAAAPAPPAAAEGRLHAVGETAPDFALPDSKGTTVTLSALRGKKNVVLVFYPGDETPGCTKQLCAIRDDSKDFESAGIQVFGINPQDAQSHRQFIEHQKYQFELLVDANKAVCTAYGTKGALMTTRTVYGIDKTGTIVFAERGMPANAKIVAAFEKK
jgi:peroxiredoxin Q/BCP